MLSVLGEMKLIHRLLEQGMPDRRRHLSVYIRDQELPELTRKQRYGLEYDFVVS